MDDLQHESSTVISSLKEQINSFQQPLELLESQKRGLEVEIEKSKQEAAENLALTENNNAELVNKIKEQEKKLQEHEDAQSRLCEELKKLENQFQSCGERLRSSEKKTEEMTHQFEIDMYAKNQEVNELEENIEGLKRDLEMKTDDFCTLEDNVRNIEVKQRLTSQKLRVTEQLLVEKDESYLKKEEKLLEEQKSLQEIIATLSGIVQTYKDAQVRMVGEISDKLSDTLTGIDAFHMKFEEDYGHIESRIYETVNELKITTNCIKDSNIKKDQLRKEITVLSQQLSDEKSNSMHLKGRIGELETTLQKDEDEKDCLIKTVRERETKMGELEKIVTEMDEKTRKLEMKMKENEAGFESLIEEKREAIRQLCIWIEYHRSRNNELKDMIAKTRRR
ncbi:hypothetical protein SASPL_133414 [Salvia splendens]|uniref:Uncharacterized protein n=2 Tax=Salvia splendens TaxID=180675 RepID=A0A8X8X2X6_SALSN|nr:hypothetical protein SASPL_133414 [Salvia splendens]